MLFFAQKEAISVLLFYSHFYIQVIHRQLLVYMYSVLYTLINVFLGQVYLVGCLHPEKLDCTQKLTLRTIVLGWLKMHEVFRSWLPSYFLKDLHMK